MCELSLKPLTISLLILLWLASLPIAIARADEAHGESNTYRKIRSYLDSVPAIDTHDHLWPFDKLPGYVDRKSTRLNSSH